MDGGSGGGVKRDLRPMSRRSARCWGTPIGTSQCAIIVWYQELKQELGLGDYEGRGWRGFHHHATLCIAAYGFLIAERGAFPPSGPAASPPPSPGALVFMGSRLAGKTRAPERQNRSRAYWKSAKPSPVPEPAGVR